MASRYERDKELWADDAAAAPAPRQQRQPREPGAPSLKAQATAKRVQRQASIQRTTKSKVRRRQRWEASPQGVERMSDVVDAATAEHNRVATERPELGLTPQKRLKLTHQQAYEHYGFANRDPGPGPRDVQLPGMEDPHALPRPKRWEEHTPEEQAHIAARVKTRTGSTIDSMTRAYGAQVDQAFLRARGHGTDTPHASDFYTSGEPAQVLRRTAARQGVPLGLVAAVNADTSPQMKFSHTNKAGQTTYPNAEQAEHIISEVKSGTHPSDVTKEGLTGLARTGFGTNVTKAARRVHQVLRYGVGVRDTYVRGEGGSGFGPKTAAYHNSWLGGTPEFTVSDVHTGGGGFLPHLGSEKPMKTDEHGNPEHWESGAVKRVKSEREEGIATKPEAGFHAMADYAARQAMGARGLHSARQTQATQWGEERIRRHETAQDAQTAAAFPSGERAYGGSSRVAGRQFDPKQGRLF